MCRSTRGCCGGCSEFAGRWSASCRATTIPIDHRRYIQPGAAPVHPGRDFIQEIRDLVPASHLTRSSPIRTWRNERQGPWRASSDRAVAWQFASPVRWMRPGLLFIEEAPWPGCGAVRGSGEDVADLSGLAATPSSCPNIPQHSGILNADRDGRGAVRHRHDPEPEPELEEPADSAAESGAPEAATAAPAPAPAAPSEAPSDTIGFDAADATLALIRSRPSCARPDRRAGLHRVHHRRRVVAA